MTSSLTKRWVIISAVGVAGAAVLSGIALYSRMPKTITMTEAEYQAELHKRCLNNASDFRAETGIVFNPDQVKSFHTGSDNSIRIFSGKKATKPLYVHSPAAVMPPEQAYGYLGKDMQPEKGRIILDVEVTLAANPSYRTLEPKIAGEKRIQEKTGMLHLVFICDSRGEIQKSRLVEAVGTIIYSRDAERQFKLLPEDGSRWTGWHNNKHHRKKDQDGFYPVRIEDWQYAEPGWDRINKKLIEQLAPGVGPQKLPLPRRDLGPTG